MQDPQSEVPVPVPVEFPALVAPAPAPVPVPTAPAEVQAGASTAPGAAETVAGFVFHPCATLFPAMGEREFAALTASIKLQGQLEPVWTWQGQVIDGRHRLRACAKLGLTPITREWDGAGSLLEFVIGLNLHRRHLKERQRAMLAARLKPNFEAEARERQGWAGRDSDLAANWRQGRSSAHAGKLLNVSQRSVERAQNVLLKGSSTLIASVDACKLAVSTASELAELPAEEQNRLVGLKTREIAAALKVIRAAQKNAAASLPKQRDYLVDAFSAGRAKIRRDGKRLVIEFTDNFIEELCAAVRAREHFTVLMKHGVYMVWKQSA